jgi:dTDP-4-amino-4,6-dideoxygalactose transaminase
MSTLALLGGTPVRTAPFPAYKVIGEEEKAAVNAVMDSGILSRFLGTWHPDFFGGPEVQAFEKEWAAISATKHAISVNSCTSGLYAAVGAVGAGPGDEVICSPYTMIASATAAVAFNAVPVFADIDPKSYCISAATIAPKITERTKAIIVVHIFGQAADMDPIMDLAKRHGIKVIEDCAQAPFGTYKGRPVGSLGDVGVFSLNYHKHIHTGEGGVCTTEDDRLADRLRMIRNHGENVTGELARGDITNIVGFNFRLSELHAAVGIEQLKKVAALVDARERISQRLSAALAGMEGLAAPKVRPDCRHVYYEWSARYDAARTGVPRELFARALEAEGVPVSLGYVQPLYMLPLFQQRRAFGRDGYPFTLTNSSYQRGLCPVAERMHEHELLEVHVCSYTFDEPELAGVVAAFEKVHANRGALTRSAR